MAEEKDSKIPENKDTDKKEVKPKEDIKIPKYSTLSESQTGDKEGISKLLIEILKNK